jgi:hypothetical protein
MILRDLRPCSPEPAHRRGRDLYVEPIDLLVPKQKQARVLDWRSVAPASTKAEPRQAGGTRPAQLSFGPPSDQTGQRVIRGRAGDEADVDFQSPALTRNLHRMPGRAAAADPAATVRFSEMLPAPHQCWLEHQGARYTSELRLVAVDRTRRETVPTAGWGIW